MNRICFTVEVTCTQFLDIKENDEQDGKKEMKDYPPENEYWDAYGYDWRNYVKHLATCPYKGILLGVKILDTYFLVY